MKIREMIAPCATMADLMHVWQCSQTTLKTMPVQDMLALTAMKDFYKGMIQRKEIDAYLALRRGLGFKHI